MYVRTIKRKNKDGSVAEYVQLAHNEWNHEKGFAQAKVKQEKKPDGKYLLSSSDKSLSAEHIALGYKQLMEVDGRFGRLKRRCH